LAVNGFVYVIESPAGRDLLDGRTEGRVLTEALRLATIPHWYSLASDKEMFVEALGLRLGEAWKYHQKPPILHLSMHGSADGLSLTCGEFLSWHDLRGLLLPLLRAMQGGLLVCMSSCFGSAGCRMAMYADNEPHFWALVGNTASPTWADAAIAYASFYHLFFKGFDIKLCVDSMKVASGDHRFTHLLGANMKAGWDTFTQQRQQQIAAAVPQAAAETESKGYAC
jgi:hypothetical protein